MLQSSHSKHTPNLANIAFMGSLPYGLPHFRSLEAEKHKAMMDELHRNNDKLLRQVKFLTAEEEVGLPSSGHFMQKSRFICDFAFVAGTWMTQAAQRELKEKTEQLIQDKLQVEVRTLWAYKQEILHMPHASSMCHERPAPLWRVAYAGGWRA